MADDPKDPGLLLLPTMVRWFRPRLLANAAIRAAISPVFGTYADARVTQASVDGYSPEDVSRVARRYELSPSEVVSSDGAVWVDYLADTADGFDSTYAMAWLVAQDALGVSRRGSTAKHTLFCGRVFILGGDQVYPYPSRQEYEARFVFPFGMAFSDPAQPRLTFVIPGNHDWYDGLNSFDFLFCQARFGIGDGGSIGNMHFTQHRSYFAVRLPNNWWIWGADIQFSQYLDVGQVRYFQAVADIMRDRKPEEPEHKIIMCIAEPGWQYEDELAQSSRSNLAIVSGIADQAGAKVVTVLSGDSHHYCRYYAKELGLNLITAGGGGAFLHPTHQLYNTIRFKWLGTDYQFDLNTRPTVDGEAGRGSTAFPARLQSRLLTFGNLLFPMWNYTFATLLGTLYWLMTWMYSQTAVWRANCVIRPPGGRDFIIVQRPLIEDILVEHTTTCGLQGATLREQIQDLIGVSISAGINNFLLGIFAIGLLAACIGYADARRLWKKTAMGILHWTAHIIAMVVLFRVVTVWGTPLGRWLAELGRPFMGEVASLLQTATYVVLMIFGGGTIAGLVWGMYLFISCAIFHRHTNDAFSALRIADYKNFLRMKIDGEVLTIYPIGLRRTPSRLEWQRESGKPNARFVPRMGIAPELIDGPIVIDARTVRMRREAAPAMTGELT
jgi:hypothetical protein